MKTIPWKRGFTKKRANPFQSRLFWALLRAVTVGFTCWHYHTLGLCLFCCELLYVLLNGGRACVVFQVACAFAYPDYITGGVLIVCLVVSYMTIAPYEIQILHGFHSLSDAIYSNPMIYVNTDCLDLTDFLRLRNGPTLVVTKSRIGIHGPKYLILSRNAEFPIVMSALKTNISSLQEAEYEIIHALRNCDQSLPIITY